MKDFKKILWGIVLIALGILIGSNRLGFTNINIFFKGWWTLFIIVPSVIGLFDEEDKKGPLIGLIIGVALLLAVRDIINFSIIRKLLLPVILVLVGFSIILEDTKSKDVKRKVESTNENDLDSIVSMFGNDYKIIENTFKGANIDTVFGHLSLDLKNADIKKEAIIKASAIFGGIDIIAPQNTTVKIKSTNIFGGTTNRTIQDKSKNIDTIYIQTFTMFGGINIK